MIHLEEIDENNWRCPLTVKQGQSKFVSPCARILARAYAYREARSQAKLIYCDDTAVGMLLYYDCPERDAYDFSQLMIDQRYQGRGYGMEAAKQAIAEMKEDGTYHKICLCYIEGNDTARRMYEKLGFRETGEREEDEIIMELSWQTMCL